MGNYTRISWCDATWNPVRGCTKISAGCKHCYAERFAERWRGTKRHPFERGFDLRLVWAALTIPRHWRKPRRIFVCSMSDLFHVNVPDHYLGAVVGVIDDCPRHRFLVLTKRSRRMMELFNNSGWIRQNVELGVSVENREALHRIDDLRDTRATYRFLSAEPLLEDLGTVNLDGIDLVLAGGESGPGARECKVEWILNLRDQCVAQGVAFYLKQMGGARGQRDDPATWPEELRSLRCGLVQPSIVQPTPWVQP